MASINLKDQAAIDTSGLSAKMGVNNEAGLDILDSLALGTPLALEDIIYYDNGGDILYKGVVQTIDHNLDDEGVDSTTMGCEQYINTQPWVPVNRFYNDTESTCGISFNEATIQDFIDQEFVGDVTTWLTAIELDEDVAGSIGDLLLPRMDLLNVGFMDAIQQILRLHPFLRWTIEYSDSATIFPVGKIVIFNAQDGRASHILTVGGAAGTVTSLAVTQSSTECAKHVQVHARGKFVERYEVLQPFWSQYEESIPEFDIQWPMPNSAGASTTIPEGHDFPQTVHLYAVNVEAEYAQGGIIHQTAFRIFPGTDYIIDMETGQITFLTPEDGETWPWVDGETGETTSGNILSFGGIAVGISNARRPVAYQDNHVNEGEDVSKQIRAYYYRPGDTAYKHYRTRYPIADFRIRRETKDGDSASNPETADSSYVLRKEDESITVYAPNLQRMRESEDATDDAKSDAEIANQIFDPDWTPRTVADEGTWYREDPQGNAEISAPTISPISLLATQDIGVLTARILQRYFTEIEGGVSFEEGTQCINLSQRQLAAYPKIYTGGEDDDDGLPQTGLGGGTPSGLDDTLRIARARWVTWPVVAHYTSWEELIEERTTSFGGERYYRGIVDSVFRYEDLTGESQSAGNTNETLNPPYVIFDNTGVSSVHSDIADESADYFGNPYWTGRITTTISRVGQTVSDPASTAAWVIPYKIGDICTITGEVSGALSAAFSGLIVAINYDRLKEGVIELEFGRREPRVNPFLPRDELPLNIENDNLTGAETAGMKPIGGSQ